MIEKITTIIGATFGILGLVVGVSALFALPVWLLWNWLCPPLFGLPTLGFMQSWGLNILCGCLFQKSVPLSSSKK